MTRAGKILEDYYGHSKDHLNTSYEIFKSPSDKELRDVIVDGKYRAILFIFNDNSHEYYAFNVNLLHGNAMTKISPAKQVKSYYRLELTKKGDKFNPVISEMLPVIKFYLPKGSITESGLSEAFDSISKDIQILDKYKIDTSSILRAAGKQIIKLASTSNLTLSATFKSKLLS